MKKISLSLAAFIMATFLITSCKKEIKQTQSAASISASDEAQIKRLGFGIKNIIKVDEGYIVEGDILLTYEHLKMNPKMEFLRIGNAEQYRTFNTVYNLPRTITIRVGSGLNSTYITALNAAIARYNALNLLIHFTRVTIGGQIVMSNVNLGGNVLASAGFPTDAGQPFNIIRVNASILNTWNANTKTTILAHEIGHCIGLRHTDFFNRSISCNGSAVNEGQTSAGARLIPGTPSGATNAAASWMLSCIGNGVNRPFNSADQIALNFLY